MDNEQFIEISLKEYLEFQKLKEHEKMVQITTFVKRIDKAEEVVGSSVYWKSDGKCWMDLAVRLSDAGELIGEKVQEIDSLKLKIEKYKKWRKRTLLERLLNKAPEL